jgi:hypothetical protein
MRLALLLLTVAVASADPPADVLKLFRTSVEALAASDAQSFLDHFDRNMPQFAVLRDEVEMLLASHEVGSTMDIVNDEGTDQQRKLDLDWLLVVSDKGQRRQIVKCTVQKQGRQWKITAIEPLDFFKFD